jgi:hypothetical protein
VADRDVTVDIIARDKTAQATRSATRSFQRLKRNTDDSSSSLDKLQQRAARFGKSMLGVAKSVGRVTATVSAAVSAVGPLTAGLIGATKAAVAFGKATARTVSTLAPLTAFLPSLVGSAGLLVGTLKLAGPGLVKALKPVTSAFVDADGNAGKITKRLQTLIAVGVEPLAKQFAKVNLPTIAAGMDRIALATNSVVRSVGSWLNSLAGQHLIATVTNATAAAAEKLAPKITAAAIAVGRLADRAGDKAITGFADLIGRILDKFTAWAEGTSVEDINRGISKLRDTAGQARSKLADMQAGLQWLIDHQGQIKTASNVLAGIAVVLGAATGNWGAAIAGAAMLIVNNFGSIKGAVTDADGAVQQFARRLLGDASFKRFFNDQVVAVRRFVDGFRSSTQGLGEKWSELVTKLTAAWHEWEPLIHGWWVSVRPIFHALGIVIGAMVTSAVENLGRLADVLTGLGVVVKAMVRVVLAGLDAIIGGAAEAFGWVPGIGPKLQEAAAKFSAFRDRVNASLDGIKDQTVTVNVVAKTSTTTVNGKRVGVGEGNTIPRTGAFSRFEGWRPAQVARALFAAGAGSHLALAGAATSRVGGPTQVESTVNVDVNLEGKPFRAMTAKQIDDERRRQEWRRRGQR